MSDAYLQADNVDDLARMVVALLSELWVTRDRMAVMEKLLVERGALAPSEIDDFTPAGEFADELEALRDRMVGSVIGAPIAPKDRSVEAILARAGLKRPETA